jgi:hypothetical protein
MIKFVAPHLCISILEEDFTFIPVQFCVVLVVEPDIVILFMIIFAQSADVHLPNSLAFTQFLLATTQMSYGYSDTPIF